MTSALSRASHAAWRKELAELKERYAAEQAEIKPLYAEVKQLWSIRFSAEQALDQQRRQTKEKQHEQER